MKVIAGDFKNKACSVTKRHLIANGFFSEEKIPLTDIASFDVESAESKTSGGLGTAAAGGLLFGGAGAIVGAVVGRGSSTETTAGVALMDGRRFMAKFSAPEMDLIRAAMFEVQGKSLEERRSDKSASAAKDERRKDLIGKIGAGVLVAGALIWFVLANT